MSTPSPYIDELSGAYNRSFLKDHQEGTLKTFITKNIPFSVVMVDIDHFKEINDTYGHLKGDEIIKEFAQFLKSTVRASDTVIRYGGDEFICVMPRTTRQDAELIYRRILRKCKEREFSGLNITLSVGVASFPDDGQDFEELLRIADLALYDAKRSGRDRIGLIRKKKIILPMRVFIDRTVEKEQLTQVLMNGKQMRVVIVKGNVGIGKTRLSKQILDDAKGREVIWSDCLYLAEGIAYYPIREALQYHMKRCKIEEYRSIPLAYRLELAKLVPELADGIVEKRQGIELVVDKYRLYESIRLIMEKGEHGKILIVDNIQWIDKESIEVMKYLMRSLKDNPITFVLIYRVEEITDDLEEFLSYISREVAVTDIILRPFAHTEIKDSVKAIIGEDPDPLLVDYVVRESGGIPFYIEEIVKGLVDQRFLIVEDDRWVFSRPEKEIVPKSLEDIAIRKYRTLSSEARRVVDTATVIGWFDIGIIKDITEFNEGQVLGVINHMNKLGMVKYKNDRFEFDEEVSRHALYEKNVAGIPSLELHRKIGETLEQRSKGKETDIAEMLAYHYYRGHEAEKGVRYCMEAAAQAQEKYANQYAIRYYTWAIELLQDKLIPEDIEKRVDCLYKRAEAFSVIGKNDRAVRDLEKGLKSALAMDDKKRKADILLRRAAIYHRLSQYRDAITEATKSKELYQAINDRVQMAFALNAIGYGHWSLSENGEAMASYEEAMSIFRELGEKKGEADTLNNFGTVYLGIDFNRALQYYEDSLGIYNEIENKLGASKVCNNIGILYNQLGKYQRALEYLRQSLNIQQERGSIHGEETAYVNIGNIHSALDENQEALRFYKAALKIARQTGNRESEGICLNNIGLKLDTLGEYEKALKSLECTVAITQEIGDKRTEAAALTGLGQVHQHLGDHDDAMAFYARALQIGEEQNVSWVKFGNLVSQGEFYLVLNEREKAKQYIDAAYELSQEVASRSYIATTMMLMCEYYLSTAQPDTFMKTMTDLEQFVEIRTDGQDAAIAMMLGRYYTMVKQFEKADKQFAQALDTYKKIGNRLECGKVHYYRGMMELARESEHAQECFRQSTEIFEALGAKDWKQKAGRHLTEQSSS